MAPWESVLTGEKRGALGGGGCRLLACFKEKPARNGPEKNTNKSLTDADRTYTVQIPNEARMLLVEESRGFETLGGNEGVSGQHDRSSTKRSSGKQVAVGKRANRRSRGGRSRGRNEVANTARRSWRAGARQCGYNCSDARNNTVHPIVAVTCRFDNWKVEREGASRCSRTGRCSRAGKCCKGSCARNCGWSYREDLWQRVDHAVCR